MKTNLTLAQSTLEVVYCIPNHPEFHAVTVSIYNNKNKSIIKYVSLLTSDYTQIPTSQRDMFYVKSLSPDSSHKFMHELRNNDEVQLVKHFKRAFK